jgi:hypothetical protein
MTAHSKLADAKKNAAAVEVENKWFINAGAGALGSCLAKTLLNPLQRIIVLQQLGHKGSIAEIGWQIVDEERAKGLAKDATKPPLRPVHFKRFWAGNLASMIQRIPYSSIQLPVYDRTKIAIQGAFGDQPGDVSSWTAMFAKVCASSVAAVVSGSAVYPMEVVRTRLMSGDSHCKTISGTVRFINAEAGLRGFYLGLTPSLLQRVPDIVINLTVYETVKFKLGQMGYSDQVCIISGASAAAATAVAVTFPLDVVKRNIAVGKSGMRTFDGPLDCARSIFQREGVAGFYAGARLELVRCIPQVVLMWQIVEYSRGLFGRWDASWNAKPTGSAGTATH